MGYSKQVYIDGYLVIEPLLQTRDITYYDCGCQKVNYLYDDKRFCAQCGHEFHKTVVQEECKPTFRDLMQKDESLSNLSVDQDFNNKDVFILVANHNYLGGKADYSLGDTDDFDEYIELTPEIVTQDLKLFKEYYAKIIDFLKPLCKTLEVKFGVIKYFS